MLLVLACGPVQILVEVTCSKHILSCPFSLPLQPGAGGGAPEARPCRAGSIVLAICASDEHSTREKLSVPPQAGAGQRGSGRASQKGTKLRPLSRGTKTWQPRKTHYPHSDPGRGEQRSRLMNFMDSFPTDKCRGLADRDTEANRQGLRIFCITKAESALNGTGSRVKGVFVESESIRPISTMESSSSALSTSISSQLGLRLPGNDI
ncbi:hypothetical protein MHYP_G00318130 [Metynnis hypsauchen]